MDLTIWSSSEVIFGLIKVNFASGSLTVEVAFGQKQSGQKLSGQKWSGLKWSGQK